MIGKAFQLSLMRGVIPSTNESAFIILQMIPVFFYLKQGKGFYIFCNMQGITIGKAEDTLQLAFPF